ncbi:LysR family transcriptional regulator substrate-binding protein [Geomicrobium sp. JCM 19055]|uniref:LysR family transcriptional regulator substrate-binding protein n=1 Tax=Geomicrobium sp. JCM 19055 TaxID=1460649 RepID=UPI00045ED519|nr:LysR substrate-binding domain-containing protein [Geomicrobium sp. JCM 19055]GAJ99706.1 LysR family regulatory protein [Geomicrobium sp. JCM 19055]
MVFLLFERSKRKVTLTESGERFYEANQELMNRHKALTIEVNAIREGGSGKVIIGMIESTKNWMASVVMEHNALFPSLMYQFQEILRKEDVIQSIHRYDTHVSITNYFINTEGIASLPLYKEDIVAISKNPISTTGTISMRTLGSAPLILPPKEYQTHKDILDAFRIAETEPIIKFEVERFETALAFVNRGLGVAMIPKSYVSYSEQFTDLYVYTMIDPTPTRMVYVNYHLHRYLPEAITKLISLTLEFNHNLLDDAT